MRKKWVYSVKMTEVFFITRHIKMLRKGPLYEMSAQTLL